MSLFTIDQEKCKRDGICARVCPIGIIEFTNDNGVPMPAKDAETLCINCGHCVAACPHSALSHRAMTPEACMPVLKNLFPTAEQAEQLLKSRRSIRVYEEKAVDRKLLERLVDVARFAPSGVNSQPVEWLIIHTSSEVQRLAGCVIDWMRSMIKERPQFAAALHMERTVKNWESGMDTICRKAPHVIVTHASKDNPMAASSCPIALAHLELAAHAVGLGACWAGYFDAAARFWPAMRKELGLPEGHVSYGAMMVGYPKFSYYRIPKRNEARIAWR
jgi:nitroreductase/NAD-dependent dihydropyrimidine dehydrogenase PreA subunit